MKIAIISGDPKLLINFRGALLAAFVGAGHEVVVFGPGEDEFCATGEVEDVIARLAKLGIGYRLIDLDRTGLNPINDVRTFFHLLKLLRSVRPDIALSYNHKPIIYGSLAAQLAGVPQRFSLATGFGLIFSRSDTFKSKLTRALILQLYRLSLIGNEAVFIQNPDDLAFFVESGFIADPTRAVLINGSGVDLNFFSQAPPYMQRPVFLLMARLLKEKGIPEYVEAARIVKEKYPQASFRLLGPFYDNYASSCIKRTEIEGWQQEGVIEYLGEVRDVRPFIRDTSVFVLPSYFGEGTPRSVLEAMAMGRPIITTDTPGCRETVLDEVNGFLVPAKDVMALAKAMEEFIVRSELIVSMGKRSREIAAEKYDVHKVNATIMRAMGLAGDEARNERGVDAAIG